MNPFNLTDMSLGYATWLYNVRRVARLLTGQQRYPLYSEHDLKRKAPVFFVSAGRSGTTLLRSMLVAGGEIAMPPQSYVLNSVVLQFQSMQEQNWATLTRLALSLFEAHEHFERWEFDMKPVYQKARALPQSQQTFASLINLLFMSYAEEYFPDAITWGDQSIENTIYVQWLAQAFPNAFYVHVLRDGRDVVASWVEQGRELDDAIDQWIESLRKVDMLQKKIPASQYHEVRYETLVTDPKTALQSLCGVIGISYSDDMLKHHQKKTTVEHRYDEKLHGNLKKAVFKSSVGGWRSRLTDAQQDRVQERLSPFLIAQKYEL